MQTSIRVDQTSRDALAKIANDEMGGVSMDDALKVLLFEHASLAAIAALEADPAALAEYRAEAREWAELDTQVSE
ncbi:hypothetical protein [Catelliglobosispora koreensis]|uniref:hypothetical protein n=1 Tax=Catelliglobosispora koreensis TaxID=129052 RepID=UPI00036A8567|nr:hypothetical protein [Catelliglobosispora koreensis]